MANDDAADQPQQDTTEQTTPADLIPLGTTGDVISAPVLETLTGAAGSDVIEIKPAGLLSDEGLARAIAGTPAERVTEEYIRSRIAGTDYLTLPNTTVTICHITLDNGYSVRGESACVNPANFRQDIGERIAHDDAFRKLWPLFGFLLAEANHRRGQGVPAVPIDLIARTAHEAEQAGGGNAWNELTAEARAAVMERVGNLLADPAGEGENITFRAVVRGLTA
ncbi:Gp49 family protein [Azospirillum sp. B506]|uniref:Gp49 family protein n=1 Tax=Azospirillum sp. B506 TaxID=137721 RepID=UPI000349547E|nr:Gp49 family protein [Azospirillum sp. B506]